jgi:uncharacterized protein with PIN domain
MGNSESRRKATLQRRGQIRSKPSIPQSDDLQPTFVADVMLGRLAKWIRIAGFDVLYSNRFSDDELVALSRQQGRILLSRDTRLLVRKAVRNFIFLESESIQSQLRQVFEVARIAGLPEVLTRCLSCNDVLVEITRERVRERVPPFVFATQPSFKSCPRCEKVYWAGTHRQSVLRTLEKLLQ